MGASRRYTLPQFLLAATLLHALRGAESRSLALEPAPGTQRRVAARDAQNAPVRLLNEGYLPLKDCTAIKQADQLKQTGIYKIHPGDKKGEFTTLCHMNLLESNGWTVIQRRVDGTLNFQRTWREYRNGFGEFYGNFWLGLHKIKRITDMGSYELYVGMEDFDGHYSYAIYSGFYLGTEQNNFTLYLGSYDPKSTADDALSVHNMQPFSTPDRDNSKDPTREIHCAKERRSGWWFGASDCFSANLNGIWYDGTTDPNSVSDGIGWSDPQVGDGAKKLIHSTIMALRKV